MLQPPPFDRYGNVSCCDCSDYEALYNWEGDYRGFVCRNNGEYCSEPMHGHFTDLSCHSALSAFESMDEALDSFGGRREGVG